MQYLAEAVGNADLIIFDLDGTIVYLDADWSSLKKELSDFFSEKYDLHLSFSPMQPSIKDVTGRFGNDAKNEISGIIKKYEDAALPDTRLNREMIHMITQIPSSANLAVFSANLHGTIVKALEKAGILHKFSFIVGFDDVKYTKPDPLGLEKILAYFNCPSSKALYIGDKDVDVAAGKAANIKTYNISTGTIN